MPHCIKEHLTALDKYTLRHVRQKVTAEDKLLRRCSLGPMEESELHCSVRVQQLSGSIKTQGLYCFKSSLSHLL